MCRAAGNHAAISRRRAGSRASQCRAINDLTDPATLAHLLKYDSAQGGFNKDVRVEGNILLVDDERIEITAIKNPAELWQNAEVDTVLECTGIFTSRDKASGHLRPGGPKRVIISAPAKGGDVPTKRELVRDVQEGLEVKPASESNIINISWTGRSPSEAARMANAFARAYVDVALDSKTGPAKQDTAWFKEQVKASRQKLEQAQAKLPDLQQQAGIVGSEEQAEYELARLNELSTQLTLIQAQTTDPASKRGASRDTIAEVNKEQRFQGK